MPLKLCIWCGEYIPDSPYDKCRVCRRRITNYNAYARNIHHSTPIKTLLDYKELLEFLHDSGFTPLPDDLDYQLDRVNRYIKEKTQDD